MRMGSSESNKVPFSQNVNLIETIDFHSVNHFTKTVNMPELSKYHMEKLVFFE